MCCCPCEFCGKPRRCDGTHAKRRVLLPVCRGKFRSKPWAAVLEEAKRLVASGVRELNLIAEDTNQYGMVRKRRVCVSQWYARAQSDSRRHEPVWHGKEEACVCLSV
jgi:hypothetical protein